MSAASSFLKPIQPLAVQEGHLPRIRVPFGSVAEGQTLPETLNSDLHLLHTVSYLGFNILGTGSFLTFGTGYKFSSDIKLGLSYLVMSNLFLSKTTPTKIEFYSQRDYRISTSVSVNFHRLTMVSSETVAISSPLTSIPLIALECACISQMRPCYAPIILISPLANPKTNKSSLKYLLQFTILLVSNLLLTLDFSIKNIEVIPPPNMYFELAAIVNTGSSILTITLF